MDEKQDCRQLLACFRRPSGCPAADVRAHIQPIQHQHLHQLQKIFDQLQSQNTLLQRNLKKHHDKMMQSRSAMREHLDTWKKVGGSEMGMGTFASAVCVCVCVWEVVEDRGVCA